MMERALIKKKGNVEKFPEESFGSSGEASGAGRTESARLLKVGVRNAMD